jgi:exodeoxyribonuclease VII small subunit
MAKLSSKKNQAGSGETDSSASTFESRFTRLEEIVEALEDGQLPLEDSLKLYEEGMRALQQCQALLDQAEQKIQVLTSGPGGQPLLKQVSSAGAGLTDGVSDEDEDEEDAEDDQDLF